ncbi:MAG: hypothetical protein ABIC96_01670 [Patescibacteria group bacterium]
MKTKLVCSLIIVLLIDVLFLGLSFGDEQAARQGVKDVNLEKRRAAVKDWVDCAHVVAQKTFDHEAYDMLEFFQKNAVYAFPTVIKGKALIAKPIVLKGDERFTFLMLLEDDREIAPFFREEFDKLLVGDYYMAGKVLTIRDKSISDIWKGLIILHEGRHVQAMVQTPYDWEDKMKKSEHERDVHIFQYRLAAAIGGEAYEKALQGEINKIEGPSSKTKESWVGAVEYDKALDKAFGPAKSQIEIQLRQVNLWIDAYFHIFDKNSGANSHKVKAVFLKNYYQSIGKF